MVIARPGRTSPTRAQRADSGPEIRGIRLLTHEAWERFDAEARRALGMSGEEFLRKWEAGEFASAGEQHLAVLRVAYAAIRPAGLMA